ncbi:MAG: hypothetical protein DBX47_02650 [Clostridiales bacterium]|nr:MAG: hypothetical protein DBX47_02650 [Clostridiales bacterium]
MEKISHEKNYDGFMISLFVDTYENEGKNLRREVIEHPGAACVLPIDQDNNTYIVEQFRFGPEIPLWELPAGKMDKGESPEACAVRELEEETGAVADEIIYMGPMYPTPAYSQEIIHLYVAKVTSFVDPHTDENEDLKIKKIPFSELLAMIDRDEIADSKTAMLALKWARASKNN